MAALLLLYQIRALFSHLTYETKLIDEAKQMWSTFVLKHPIKELLAPDQVHSSLNLFVY